MITVEYNGMELMSSEDELFRKTTISKCNMNFYITIYLSNGNYIYGFRYYNATISRETSDEDTLLPNFCNNLREVIIHKDISLLNEEFISLLNKLKYELEIRSAMMEDIIDTNFITTSRCKSAKYIL